jgi:hypothetical protein
MFGHDEPDDDNQNTNVVQPEPAADDTVQDNSTQSDTVHVDINNEGDLAADAAPEAADDSVSTEPVEPATTVEPAEKPEEEATAEEPEEKPTPEPEKPSNDAPTTVIGGNSALMEIKRSALQELSPLLDELTQPPEEKFRTTMMMIQAFDDQKLVGKAYEAAKAIKDRKERAEALLDIVNEINYFTTESEDSQES